MEKDNFNANVDFVRGQADMIVLSALSDSDKYGLEILSTIQERSQGMYSLKQATLYSSLKRLEKNGYVHSYDGDISNGAKRVYYGLTDVGRDHLDNDKSYWEFCNFLMSNLISDNKFDPQNEDKPFDPAEFRPLTRRVRGEKEDKDKEQEKEVVVKYVYVKSDENAPEGAEIVYLPQDQIHEVQVVQDNTVDVVENQDDSMDTSLPSDDCEQSSDLSELDFDLTEVCVDCAEEQNSTQSNEAFTEYNAYSTTDEVSEINSSYEVFSDLADDDSSENEGETTSSEIETSQDENDDIETHDDTEETVNTLDETNQEEVVELHENTSNNNRTEVIDAQETTQDYTQQYENQYTSFGNRPVRNQNFDSSASMFSQFANYSYENNDVNYVGTFTDLFDVEDEEIAQPDVSADIEFMTMKEMVYKYQSKGISIKTYDKKNTMEYYVNRYYFSNKLHMHTSLIIFALLAVEIFISHFICNRGAYKVSDAWLLSIFAVAIYPAIRGIMYVIDPTKKTLANYNPKTSLLISLLPVITLPIVFALIGFVEFGANINDYMSMERPIILPSILLFNVPLYYVVFTLLYRTNNYHVN